MKNRTLIENIIRAKTRNNPSEFNSLAKLKEIDELLKQISQSSNVPVELLKYIPVQSIAFLQSYFRELLEDLITKEHVTIENVERLLKSRNIKFEISTLNALNKKKFSLGELVAHFFTIHSIDELNYILSILIDGNFLNELSNYSSGDEERKDDENWFKENFGSILESIKKTFELRNIICHEYAFQTNLDLENVKEQWRNIGLFVSHCHLFFSNYKDPIPNKSFKELSKEIKVENESLMAKLDSIARKIVIENIEKSFNTDKFEKSYDKWKEYVKFKIDAKWGFLKPLELDFFYFVFMNSALRNKLDELDKLYVDISTQKSLVSNSTQIQIMENYISEELEK